MAGEASKEEGGDKDHGGEKEKEKEKEKDEKKPIKSRLEEDPENFNPFQQKGRKFPFFLFLFSLFTMVSYSPTYLPRKLDASSSEDEDDTTTKKKLQITIRAKSELESAPPAAADDALKNTLKGFAISSADDKKRARRSRFVSGIGAVDGEDSSQSSSPAVAIESFATFAAFSSDEPPKSSDVVPMTSSSPSPPAQTITTADPSEDLGGGGGAKVSPAQEEGVLLVPEPVSTHTGKDVSSLERG